MYFLTVLTEVTAGLVPSEASEEESMLVSWLLGVSGDL